MASTRTTSSKACGAADADGDGVVTLTELAAYLDAHVADEATRRGGVQKPTVNLDVQEPAKFLLTIDAARIRVNEQQSAARACNPAALTTLRQLYLDGKLTVDQYQQGQELLKATDSALPDDQHRQQRAEYVNVVDGTLAPEKLQRALDAIETPSQRAERRAREAAAAAAVQRTARIRSLMESRAGRKTTPSIEAQAAGRP